jgi:hypothetical protein
MKYFDVKVWATVEETVNVRAWNEDDAAEIALQIVRSGRISCNTMDWEVEEVNAGDPIDVAE